MVKSVLQIGARTKTYSGPLEEVRSGLSTRITILTLPSGGGGTFGVVLSATTRASPATKIQMVLVTYPADATDLTRELWSVMIDHSVEWAKAGWGLLSTSGTTVYINPVLSQADAAASMTPITNWAKSKTGVNIIVKEFPDYPSYFTFFTSSIKAVSAFVVR
jgi:hypothetical protein